MSKTPVSYQVPGYEEGSHFAKLRDLASEQYTQETKKTIAQAMSQDPHTQDIKSQVAEKQQELAYDRKIYNELLAKKQQGTLSAEEKEQLYDLHYNKLEEVYNVSKFTKLQAYHGESDFDDERRLNDLSNHTSNYYPNPVLSNDAKDNAYESMGVEVLNFETTQQASRYMQNLFGYTSIEGDIFDPENELYPSNYGTKHKELGKLFMRWRKEYAVLFSRGHSSMTGDSIREYGYHNFTLCLPIKVNGQYIIFAGDGGESGANGNILLDNNIAAIPVSFGYKEE